MPRLMLRDEHWSKLHMIMREENIYGKKTLRLIVEGILYRLRVGCPWRDLPGEFGLWNTIYKRFTDWSSKGKLMKIFYALSQEPDVEWTFIDGSIVKAHQHSSGAARQENQGIGDSRGGKTTKIHMAVDAFGLPIEFRISGGQVNDITVAPELIEALPRVEYVVADKGYDSEALRDQVREKSSTPIIPRKNNSTIGNDDMDWCLYKYRHLVENIFARLKHFRAIATRYDKLKRNFQGMLALACSFLWLPM